MHETIISWFVNFPKELATLLIAAVPVTELRVAIPVAYKIYNLSALAAWFYSVLGTYVVMVIIVILLEPLANFLSCYFSLFKRFFNWLFEHTRKRANHKFEKYGVWAVFVLAAIPVPFLGGMTGALVPLHKSLPLLLLGTMLSGGIVLGIAIYF